MSEVMTCMPFEQLMNWVLEEKKTKGTVFGQHKSGNTDRTCCRTAYTVNTEHCCFLLCRRTFL